MHNLPQMKQWIFRSSLLINVLAFALALMTFCRFEEEILDKLFTRNKATIVFFGDSSIEYGRWKKLLGRMDVKNLGFTGFTTAHFKFIEETDVVRNYEPRVVCILAGINDITFGIPFDQTKANYQAMIDRILTYENLDALYVQSTLYQNPDNQNTQVDSLNTFLQAYCAKKNVRFIDLNGLFSENHVLKAELTTDGTHLRPEAYEIWAAFLEPVLSETQK